MRLLQASIALIGLSALVASCGSPSEQDDLGSSEALSLSQKSEIQAALSGSQVVDFAPHRLKRCAERRVKGQACENLAIETKPVRIGVVKIKYIPDLNLTFRTAVPVSVKAMLDVIAAAEGTADTRKCSDLGGYNISFNFACMTDLLKHPKVLQRSERYESDASGRYQFLSTTWDIALKAINPILGTLIQLSGLTEWLPFGPQFQDTAAAVLIKQKRAASGAWQELEELNPDADGVWRGHHFKRFQRILNGLAPEWASLPTLRGTSAYGQPVHAAVDLFRVYQAAYGIYSTRGDAVASQGSPSVQGQEVAFGLATQDLITRE